jgi:hypothetical protein
MPRRVDFGASPLGEETILFSMPGTDAPPTAGPSQATAPVTTPPASALVAGGVAGTFGPDVGNELNDAVRIAPMADGRIIVAIAIWTGVTAPTRAARKNATRWTR